MSRWHNPGAWRELLLAQVRSGILVKAAAANVGVTKGAIFAARRKDPEFAARYAAALSEGRLFCRRCGTRKEGANCRTCQRDVARRYRLRHPERFTTEARRAEMRSYYERNKEKVNRDSAEWRRRNPEKRAEIIRRYDSKPEVRLRRRRAGRAAADYMRVLLRDPCSYCGASMEHVDHIKPIAQGGVHDWANLTAACRRCNMRKRDLPLLRFLIRRTCDAPPA